MRNNRIPLTYKMLFCLMTLMLGFQGVQPALAMPNSSQDVALLASVTTIRYDDLVIDEARGQLYGADKAGNKIDVIDAVNLNITSSYSLTNGAAPTSIALSPDGNELAVAQSGLSQVEFIDLSTGTMTDLASPIAGKGYDVIYGRTGILYVLSDYGIHVVDLTQSPHAEDTAQYIANASQEKFGVLSSDKNALFYVTGSDYSSNRLYKYDISSGLAKPIELGYAVLGGITNIRPYLVDDSTLVTSFGTVYYTATLTLKAINSQYTQPMTTLPGHSFYVTADLNSPTFLHFLDNTNSYEVSWLSTGKNGMPGAIEATNDGNTLYVSSDAGMMKFTIGATAPGTAVSFPASNHHYRDMVVDLPRSRIYGTDTSNRIDVIDLNTLSTLDSYLLPAGANPIGIDLSPAGDELAIALNGVDTVLFINPETGAEIARVTSQHLPYDVIYGRDGRLYLDGNPGSYGFAYIHAIDTNTHTWLGKSSYILRSGAEMSITSDKNYLYANETFSPNNIYILDVQTDTPTVIYQGPHGPVYAYKFAIQPEGLAVFTSNGQVWSGDMQSQLGTLEGGAGNLIEYIPGQNVVALSSNDDSGGYVRFVSTNDYHLLYPMYPAIGGTIFEMECSSDGHYLVVNTSNGIEVIDASKTSYPHVKSITTLNATPTSSATVNYLVTFSEPVSGVDATDFMFTTTGSVTGYSVASVSPSSGPTDTYTVTVNTGLYNGTLRLDVANDETIVDVDNNSLAAVFSNGGQAYTLTKNYTTSIVSQSANDGYILESSETSSTGGTKNSSATILRVGDDASKKQYRSILSFDTSSLLDNAVIASVTLKLTKQSLVGTQNPFTRLSGLIVDLKKGSFGALSLELNDFSATATKSAGLYIASSSKKIYLIGIPSAAFTAIDIAGTTQLRLRFNLDDNNDATANYMSFYSGNYGALSSRPQLIIEYYIP